MLELLEESELLERIYFIGFRNEKWEVCGISKCGVV